MVLTHPSIHRTSRAGFSLVEMLLVVVLMMLFAGAAVISMAPLWRAAPLDEGVGRFEGLLRYARAEAAQQGRRVRLQVCHAPPSADGRTAECSEVQVQWEPEPLRQPGVFVRNEATAALTQSLNELVRVEGVRYVDATGAIAPESSNAAEPESPTPGSASASAGLSGPLPDSTPADSESFPPIIFYPDGSSDSAEILLGVVDPSETRRMVVRWNGLSGTAAHTTSRCEGAAGSDFGGSAGSAQPLEPSSVADSAMGPVSP